MSTNPLAAAADAMRRGAFVEAESICRRVLQAAPNDFHALVILGDALVRSGREADGIATLERASAVNPGHALTFTALAMMKFRRVLGRPPRARTTPAGAKRVQIRTLGLNGRFGNQLLQYAFVRFYAKEHGLTAEIPDWIGRDLFDIDDPPPTAMLPTVDEKNADFVGSLNRTVDSVYSEIDMSGYFCSNTAQWGERRDAFRALFDYREKVRERLSVGYNLLRSVGETIVAIHLRRGDYGYGPFWVAPSSWYLAWLRQIWPALQRPLLYIASDDPACVADFAEFRPWHAGRLRVEIPGAEFLIDHHMLRQADVLAASNSTFSITAAMLNARAETFVRPHPNARALVPFEPWTTAVLWEAAVDADAVPAVERALIANHLRGSDYAVYFGDHCSDWTNFARATHRELRIVETETGAIDRIRAERGIAAVRIAVTEDPARLPAIVGGARESIMDGRLEMVLFRLDPATNAAPLFELFASVDYIVMRLVEGGVQRVDAQPGLSGSFIAIRPTPR